MDSQRFMKPTYPDFRPKANQNILQNAEKNAIIPDKRTAPVEDMRYPGYNSIMADARLVTDYKSKCEYNVVPSQYGNSFRSWLQHHADGFIQVSRHRQAQHSGAYYYNATEPLPPKQLEHCDEFDCTFSRTDLKDGIGLQRKESVPALFGTFAEQNTVSPMKRIFLTDKFEGGRNTSRGRKYTPLGTSLANPRAAGYGASG
jgi:hypothetical protein